LLAVPDSVLSPFLEAILTGCNHVSCSCKSSLQLLYSKRKAVVYKLINEEKRLSRNLTHKLVAMLATNSMRSRRNNVLYREIKQRKRLKAAFESS